MMKKISSLLFLGIIILCSGSALHAQQDVKIIVHQKVPAVRLDQNMIQRIFLGKTRNWDDGSAIVLAILKNGSVHDAFLKNLIKRNPNQFRGYWNKAIFTGTGTFPKTFSDESEMLKFVAETPGAIGYVSEKIIDAEVKVITVE